MQPAQPFPIRPVPSKGGPPTCFDVPTLDCPLQCLYYLGKRLGGPCDMTCAGDCCRGNLGHLFAPIVAEIG